MSTSTRMSQPREPRELAQQLRVDSVRAAACGRVDDARALIATREPVAAGAAGWGP